MRPPGARPLALIFLLCLLGALVMGAQKAWADATLYRGAQPLGAVASEEGADGQLWVDLRQVGQLLGFQVLATDEGMTLTQGRTQVRVVMDAAVAWRGQSLYPLLAAPIRRKDRLWMDSNSVAALLNGLSGPGRLRFLSERALSAVPQRKPVTPEPEPEPEIKAEVKPEVKPEVKAEIKPEVKPELKPTVPEPKSPAPVPAPVSAVPGPAAPARRAPMVVVDPGHGGKDPGTSAHGVTEKRVNLAIGLYLEKELRDRGFNVVMTRRTDVYLKLQERTDIANRAEADVFISVHVNALPSASKTSGFEIYLMALPTDKDALALAKIENQELAEGMGSSEAADKRTETLLRILGDMQQNNKINESTGLAEALFQAGQREGLPMKRVAQAPFFVLRGAGMPSVLLETGFVTNATEAKLLAHPAYQQKIAQVMADGVVQYLGRQSL